MRLPALTDLSARQKEISDRITARRGGSVPEPGLARIRHLVATGQLRFFLLNGTGIEAGPGGAGSTATTIASWVQSACAVVPAQDYGATSGAGTLYQCGSHG